jgi:hypothetical protein
MYRLTNITDDAYQQFSMVLPNGSTFSMTIYFIPMQYGWFITNLTYGNFVLNGMRICNNPNMLFQWENILPFGLCCSSKGNREPQLQEDFASEASSLYILTQAECVAYSAYVRSGVIPSA